ncbi:uncharacterized protein LOC117926020 [Vitis riparia]|uniref:uncharacterized protein LOC117926020 n=1 Tax=Vitis riparia TaxID=96939 RepID=UPI00155A720C|nr:uncharacterized protein LOC117926020 [Vitis riparia]
MALPGALIQHIEQKQILENNVCGSTYSLNCSVLSDAHTSEVLEEPKPIPKPDVKGKEKLNCTGSLDLAYGDLNDPSRSFGPYPSAPSIMVGPIADSPKKEEPVKRVSKKKNKKKGKPAKKSLELIVSQTRPSKHGQDDAIASYQSSMENVGSPAFGKCLKSHPPSAVETSLCASENTVDPTKDSCVYNTKKDSDCFCSRISDSSTGHLLSDGWNCDDYETNACCKDLNLRMQQTGDLSTNGAIEHLQESGSFRHSSEYNPKPMIWLVRLMPKLTTSAVIFGITPILEPKLNTLTSQNDAVTNSSHHPSIQNGKVNNDLIWQKSQKDFKEGGTNGAKRSNPNHIAPDVHFLEKNFWAEQNSFSSEGLLPTCFISSSANSSSAHGIKEIGNKDQAICKRIHGNALVNPQWAAHRRLNDSPYQYLSHSSQVGSGETDCGKLKANQNYSFMQDNSSNSKKGVRGCKSNFFKHRSKYAFSHKESIHVPFELQHYKNTNAAPGVIYNSHNVVTGGSYCLRSCPSSAHVPQNVPNLRKFSVPGQGVSNEIQPDTWAKTPKMENVSCRPPHVSVDSEKGNPASSELKLSCEDKFRQDVPTQMVLKKWIPVGRKESSMLESTGLVDVNGHSDTPPFSCSKENDGHLEGHKVPVSEPATLSDPGKTSLICNPSMTSVESEATRLEDMNTAVEGQKVETAEDNAACSNKLQDSTRFSIGSQMAVQALDAAYRLQLESESVQLATGCPLAEFEKLLQSATPVISSSFVYEKCDDCSASQPSHGSLCKHQIPDVSLNAVWNWYEKPGNYGLDVKAEDSRNLKGLLTDSSSFHAHFVPFLSAVQLFCHPQVSNSQSTERMEAEIQDIREVESHSPSETKISAPSLEAKDMKHIQEEIKLLLKFDSAQELVHSFEVSPYDGNESLSIIALPAFSSNNELLFEFFESEQPQLRKPLHNKIMELINNGNSNHQAFGDPSKLACMKLHELHPASWFSVAWYPIYRIPEGNFRASFLTYHSLGYLVQRCNSTDSLNENMLCIVFPVLGLQSYNAQGECWFDLKIPVDASSKDSKLVNSSETLKERLRTLQENAWLFARGCVSKNNVKAVNRQPDYEFFISRKC